MEHVSPLIIEFHPPKTHPYIAASEVVARLRKAGHSAYLVGGGVRDLLLRLSPKDFDIVTSAHPPAIQGLFPRTIPVGVQFGVVTVFHRGQEYEVATYRTEGDYRDGRRPGWVEFADLKADLQRRDFTINGLVLDPEREEVIDWVGGLDDLRRGTLRTIGAADDRFREDALRMVRAVRFASRLNLRLSQETRVAVSRNKHFVDKVSMERIWQELHAMWTHPSRAGALALMTDVGLLETVLPELSAMMRETTGFWSAREQTLRRLERCPPNCSVAVVWACLLADVISPLEPPADTWGDDGPIDTDAGRRCETVLSRLRAPRRLIRSVGEILARRWIWQRAQILRYGSLSRIMRRDVDGHMLAFWTADAYAMGDRGGCDRLRSIAAQLRAQNRMIDGTEGPTVTGADLLKAGLPAGPHFQSFLAEAERLWLEGGLTTQREVDKWLASLTARS